MSSLKKWSAKAYGHRLLHTFYIRGLKTITPYVSGFSPSFEGAALYALEVCCSATWGTMLHRRDAIQTEENIVDGKMESEASAFLHTLEQIRQDRQNVRLVTRGLRLSNTYKESGRTSSRRSIERGHYEGSI